MFSAFVYLRYTNYEYTTTTIIEILDEAQNSEMALPTELTIFNRSMVNLENEINRLSSYSLNKSVVEEIKANVMMFDVGRVKSNLTTAEEWYDEYELEFKIDTDTISNISSYLLTTSDNTLLINSYDDKEDFINSYTFTSFSTLSNTHDLPFELTIISDDDLDFERELRLVPVEKKDNRIQIKLRNLTIR